MTIFLKTCLNFIYGYRDNYERNQAYYQDCRNIRWKILWSETFEEKIPMKTNYYEEQFSPTETCEMYHKEAHNYFR